MMLKLLFYAKANSVGNSHKIRLIIISFLVLLTFACTARFKEHLLSQTPEFRPPVETYARLVLLREAKLMKRATHPYDWNSYRFYQGVCFPRKIAEIKDRTIVDFIVSACDDLWIIQKQFPHPCTNFSGCPVCEETIARLDDVILHLERAHTRFHIVEGEEPSIPSTDVRK